MPLYYFYIDSTSMFFFQMRVNLAEEVVGVASKEVAKSDSYEKETWKHGEF